MDTIRLTELQTSELEKLYALNKDADQLQLLALFTDLLTEIGDNDNVLSHIVSIVQLLQGGNDE